MSEHATYPHVFRPITIGPVEVKNRLYQTPHGPLSSFGDASIGIIEHVYTKDADGYTLPHPHATDYFEERARGGLGLIVMGHIETEPGATAAEAATGGRAPDRWHLYTDSAVDAFNAMIERLHAHGTKVFAQLNCGQGSPSGVPKYQPVGMPYPSPLTRAQIREIVEYTAIAARNARRAGFDGVELHATHSLGAGLFLSRYWNKRTDEYGGPLENRMRLPVELLEVIREHAGPDLAVGIRMNCDEMLPLGVDSAEAGEIASRLDAAGLVDFFDLDIGTANAMHNVFSPHYQPEGYEVPYIERVRARISRAVVMGCPGRIQTPSIADEIIASGAMDMVGGVRGLYADPEYPIKAEQGRADEIRPCIGLSSCTYEGQCVMNPGVHKEAIYGVTKLTKTDEPKQLVVIGGGPAGLETARVAALRGHSVVLLERSDVIGGALNLQAKLPTRDGVLRAPQWWGDRLKDLDVKVMLGVEATPEIVLELSPDVVVVATGATFDRTGLNGLTGAEIPGWDLDFVYTPDRFLSEEPDLSGNVVVYEEDGAITASDLAWMCSMRGADVELASRWTTIASGYATRSSGHRHLVFAELYSSNVKLSPDTFIASIEPNHQVNLYNVVTGAGRSVNDVRAVILVTLRRPENQLAAALRGQVPEVRTIGDAAAPGRMAKATKDGFMLAWSL
jgi:dimethylglycine catabolism A